MIPLIAFRKSQRRTLDLDANRVARTELIGQDFLSELVFQLIPHRLLQWSRAVSRAEIGFAEFIQRRLA
jgi:hypothetical protein